ncbi:uncharacterized protein LOC113213048 [Frankliniella occidentalis]|uniref:Uncharacterized protein LOC113213048 n=1 Tax=Frankliniella occidentalis TaxID=133901 RepID=A0A6J1T3B0_FRAOC|nr:uncharacterized protein LOC113213048 [Frankliniella occidentalis]
MEASSSSFPREITPPAYGVRIFSLSEQQFIHAGHLFDTMMADEDIRRTGAFIGRLEDSAGPSDQDTLNCVNIVKDTLRTDANNPETGRPFFDPSLQLRRNVWPEKHVYEMTPASNKETDSDQVMELRKMFKRKILRHDFLSNSKEKKQTDLEKTYNASGVNGVLTEFFEQVLKRRKRILYAVNMTLEKDLRTTKDLAMSEMRSLMEHLPGGPRAGINCPAVSIGQEGATFNPHIEYCAFQGVDRLIAGAPKLWFIIPPRFYSAYLQLIKKTGVDEFDMFCNSLLLHNKMFLDPRTVIQYGIPVFTVVQQPGDIVYLLPHTIHWGINLGLNINESMNIASASWAVSGMLAPGSCSCTNGGADDSTVFNITPILRAIGKDEETIYNYQKGRLLFLMSDTDSLTPWNGRPYSTTIKMEHLLGDAFLDDEVGKPVFQT